MYKILYMSQNYILSSIYGHGTYRNRAAINVFDKLIKVLTTLASLYLTISKIDRLFYNNKLLDLA